MRLDKDNTVREKSKKFAVEVISLYRELSANKNETVLSKQFLRSGTSIGANLAESECVSSKKDFVNKLYIALKECNETLYWLELLHETGYLDISQYTALSEHCLEIKRMLTSSTKTIRCEQEIF